LAARVLKGNPVLVRRELAAGARKLAPLSLNFGIGKMSRRINLGFAEKFLAHPE